MILVNRTAMILYPKQVLYDWANKTFKEEFDYGTTDPYEHDSGTVFLIEEQDAPADFEVWIENNYEYFFAVMLEHWTPEPSLWPQEMNYPMFRDWFHVVIHTMVADCEEEPLLREDDE
ncbi:MAG: hypothetical protein KDK39_02645 [Leptospiraceae bacterium]|nr:hypothetical protein [Leptospiraceae bacterium]